MGVGYSDYSVPAWSGVRRLLTFIVPIASASDSLQSNTFMLCWQMRTWSLTGLKDFGHSGTGSDVMGPE